MTSIDVSSALLSSVPALAHEVLGNTLLGWAIALAILLAVYVGLRIAVALVGRRLGRIAARTTNLADDLVVELLAATRGPVIAAVALQAASRVLTLPQRAEVVIYGLFVIALAVQVALWANRAIGFWLDRQRERLSESDPGAITTLQGLSYVVRLAVWSAALLVLLDNLGVDVTTLVAGLGVGGIAVALAVQNVLGDLFASLSIVLDKPFVIGDFIVVGEQSGTVERVGLKTTRVRSLSGEQLVFSNSDLLSSRIRNFKRMQERRVVFSFGVTYQTPRAEVEAIPAMIREILEATEGARFDRSHFKGFGDSALLFEAVYFVLSPDYTRYMDLQQAVNLAVMERFEARDIEFAYPTRTIHVVGGGDLQVAVET
jgi:small-conductance mechanosensitive channel